MEVWEAFCEECGRVAKGYSEAEAKLGGAAYLSVVRSMQGHKVENPQITIRRIGWVLGKEVWRVYCAACGHKTVYETNDEEVARGSAGVHGVHHWAQGSKVTQDLGMTFRKIGYIQRALERLGVLTPNRGM